MKKISKTLFVEQAQLHGDCLIYIYHRFLHNIDGFVHPSVVSCCQLSRQTSSFRRVSPAGRDDWTIVLHFSWPLFPCVMKHRDIVHGAHYIRALYTVHITSGHYIRCILHQGIVHGAHYIRALYTLHTLPPGIYCRLKAGGGTALHCTALLGLWIKSGGSSHKTHKHMFCHYLTPALVLVLACIHVLHLYTGNEFV